VLDRGAHKVEPLSGGRLRVTGPPSMKSGIRFIREIELAPTGTGVTLHNTMLNSGEQPVEWSVWEVAQVDDPEEAYIPLHKGGRFPEGYSVFQTSPPEPETVAVKDSRVSLRRHRTKGGKLGGDSPDGWTEARVRGTRFRVSKMPVKGAEYPDEGRFLQLWSNPDPLPYMELEVLSPMRKLAPGERTTFTTRWSLAK
jgi:hypothetical protein